ncbi:MAG: FHA domain-containing protein [Spirochaetales bacterium]|nr:FHA domain-containing protein [Spirochaetales bacterium]
MLLNYNRDNKISFRWYLEGALSDGKPYTVPIDKDPFLIGRSRTSHLILPLKDVSRNHARIFKKDDELIIMDLESTNGTFLNNRKIEGEERLQNGDFVHFGRHKFQIFQKQEEDEASDITFISESDTSSADFAEYYDLSNREKEILFHLLEGKSTKDIADRLFISAGTAKNHILNIFKKTEVHSRVMLVKKYNAFVPGKKNDK